MDLSINVGRTELVGALEEKITAVRAEADDLVAEIEAEKADRVTTREALGAYHVQLGEMITAGRAVFVSQLHGHEDVLVSVNPDTDPIPEKPTRSQRGNSTRDLNERIKGVRKTEIELVNTLGATIKLLQLSTDDVVPVRTAEYDKLLGLSVAQFRYRY